MQRVAHGMPIRRPSHRVSAFASRNFTTSVTAAVPPYSVADSSSGARRVRSAAIQKMRSAMARAVPTAM